MNNGSKPGRILIIVISAVIIVILFFLMARKIGNYLGIQTEITTEQISLEQDRQRLAALEKIAGQEDSIMNEIAFYNKLMPAEPNEDELIQYLEKTAGASLSDFVQIRFEPRTQGSNYVLMPVKITFEGNYSDLVDFLRRLREGERAIRVDAITAGTSGTGISDIKAEIGAQAFYKGMLPAAGAAASGPGTGSAAGASAGTAGSPDTSGTSK